MSQDIKCEVTNYIVGNSSSSRKKEKGPGETEREKLWLTKQGQADCWFASRFTGCASFVHSWSAYCLVLSTYSLPCLLVTCLPNYPAAAAFSHNNYNKKKNLPPFNFSSLSLLFLSLLLQI